MCVLLASAELVDGCLQSGIFRGFVGLCGASSCFDPGVMESRT